MNLRNEWLRIISQAAPYPSRPRPSADLLYDAVDTALRSVLLPLTEEWFKDVPAGSPVIHLAVVVRGLAEAPLQPLFMKRKMLPSRESYTHALTAVSVSLRRAVSQLIEQQQKKQFTHASSLAESLHDVQFVMDQLPEEACPIVLLVTDGTVAAPNLTSYDNVVIDMNARDISCSIVCVHNPNGIPPYERYSFGVVPDFESLRFLCMMTGGTFTHATEQGVSCSKKSPQEFVLATPHQLARRAKTNVVATDTESITISTATPDNFFCSSIDIPSLLNVSINSGSTSSKLLYFSFFFGAE